MITLGCHVVHLGQLLDAQPTVSVCPACSLSVCLIGQAENWHIFHNVLVFFHNVQMACGSLDMISG